MTLDDIMTELRERYSEHLDQQRPNLNRLTRADVQRWSITAGFSGSEFYNQIAARLASGFDALELSFPFCDTIVNDIHAVITLANEDRPDLFWRVFLAFDSGEFYHDGDRSHDPVDTYTRPEIAQIVADLRPATSSQKEE